MDKNHKNGDLVEHVCASCGFKKTIQYKRSRSQGWKCASCKAKEIWKNPEYRAKMATTLNRLDRALVFAESKLNSRLVSLISSAADKLQIPIYIIGGVAVASYKYPRFTNDVDVLVYTADSGKLAQWLIERGFKNNGGNKLSKSSVGGVVGAVAEVNICTPDDTPDVQTGNVRFPDLPDNTPGMRVIDLERLLAMKIDANRYKDRADYVELVKSNKLTLDHIKDRVMPLIANKSGRRMAAALWKRAQEEM